MSAPAIFQSAHSPPNCQLCQHCHRICPAYLTPMDALLDLMAEGRRTVPGDTTSAHDDLYD
ncbi:hypothetical protein [Brucella sp. LJL56]